MDEAIKNNETPENQEPVEKETVETPEEPETPETPKETPKVPEKNRELEMERLRKKIRRLEEEKDISPVPQSVSYDPNDESENAEKYWADREAKEGSDRRTLAAIDRKVREGISQYEQEREYAERKFQSNLDDVIDRYPELELHRTELEKNVRKHLKKTDSLKSLRAVELVVKDVAFDIIRKPKEPEAEVPEVLKKVPQSRTTTIKPKAPEKPAKRTTLTSEMKTWAKEMDLDLDHTPEEIYDLYEKRFGKSKK